MKLHELGSYLLLVSFLIQSPGLATDQIKATINSSVFDGVAMPYVEPYHLGKEDYSQINNSFVEINKLVNKEIWPWVFLNSIIGFDSKVKGKFKPEKRKFKLIKGMEIRLNQKRAKEFLERWKNALIIARETDSPGVVLDLEPYNNKEIYDVDYLGEKMEITVKQVRKRLRRLGEKMAEIASDNYPEAKIHLLFSGLTSNKFFNITNWGKRSVSYIVEGMLDYNETNQGNNTYISGGELTIGYCNRNLKHLQKKISIRKQRFAKLSRQYSSLELSAPIAPWLSVDSRSGWMKRGNCGKSQIKNIAEFDPFFNELNNVYKHVWVYLAGHSGFSLKNSESMSQLYPIFRED